MFANVVLPTESIAPALLSFPKGLDGSDNSALSMTVFAPSLLRYEVSSNLPVEASTF